MDEEVSGLVTVLEELASLLALHSERDWADWIAKDVAWIRRGDGYGVLHLLSAFGGTGSLDDVVFHPMNGNIGTNAEAGPVNQHFRKLTHEAYRLASSLREDAQDL